MIKHPPNLSVFYYFNKTMEGVELKLSQHVNNIENTRQDTGMARPTINSHYCLSLYNNEPNLWPHFSDSPYRLIRV